MKISNYFKHLCICFDDAYNNISGINISDRRQVSKWKSSIRICLSKPLISLLKNDDITTISQNKDHYCDEIKIISDFTTELSTSCLYRFISGEDSFEFLGQEPQVEKSQMSHCLDFLGSIFLYLAEVFDAFGKGPLSRFEDAGHRRHISNLLTVVDEMMNIDHVTRYCSSIANFRMSDVVERLNADLLPFETVKIELLR